MDKSKIIIDTDPGHDDALAIMLAVKSGMLDIVGLTTVPGNSTIENVTRNASYILDLLDRRDLRIYSGAEKPLKRELIQAVVHGTSGLEGADTSKTTFDMTENAAEMIEKIILENKGEITLLTLGPLTNVAQALINNPELAKQINSIVIMGGAINVPGNKNRVAEFNMFVDPEAADIVFKADVRKTLIPIDVCNEMPLFMEDFEKLSGTLLYEPILSMMKQFIAGIERFEGTKGALVYDAVAAYYLLNPDAFTVEPMDILIETKGEHTFGMTIAEKRISELKNINVNVVTKVDRDTFAKDLIQILRK